jgi:NodT family efflux transporter outer membrane factor (OMF) lipoprotein
VARTYVVIRTLEQRLEIARENVRIQERSFSIANARFEGGDVTELDVAQARGLLRDTQSSIPSFERSLRQAKNALAILLGSLPGDIDSLLQGPPRIPEASEGVVVDIPAELLRRRPDIRLAELRVAAQSPLIGVAKADLYPSFALTGTIGWQATNSDGLVRENALDDIVDSDSIFWTAGPAFEWNILNYGRIRNQVRVEEARFQQVVVEYRNSVLQAYREVEDAMAGFVRSREEEQFLQDSVAAAKRSVDISLVQYREGLVDFQRVLDTQRFLTTQSNRLTVVSGSVATDLVAMYKALGGGWQIRKGKDFIPADIQEEMKGRARWGGLMQDKELELGETGKKQGGWRLPDW